MPFDLKAPTWGLRHEGTGEPAAQRRKRAAHEIVDSSEEKTVSRLVIVLARLALSNAAELREVAGILWRTVLLVSSHAICKAMKAAGVAYHKEATRLQGKTEELDKLGVPYVHVFTAMLQGMAQSEVGPGVQQQMEQFWAQHVEGKTAQQLQDPADMES